MKHQSISHGARTVLLSHILHLCFMCIHIPFIDTYLHILAQPELAVTIRNVPVWYHHQLTTFHLWCYCSKVRCSRHNVFKVCALRLSLRSPWATEMSYWALFNSQHTLKLKHNLESYIQMIQLLTWHPSQQTAWKYNLSFQGQSEIQFSMKQILNLFQVITLAYAALVSKAVKANNHNSFHAFSKMQLIKMIQYLQWLLISK